MTSTQTPSHSQSPPSPEMGQFVGGELHANIEKFNIYPHVGKNVGTPFFMLGQRAVHSRINETMRPDLADLSQQYLTEARQQIVNMTPRQRTIAEGNIVREMPQWLRGVVSMESGDKSPRILDALVTTDEAGNYKVSDDTATHVFEWHNFTHAKKQERYETEKVADHKRWFLARIRRAMQKSRLPDLSERQVAVLQDIPVRIDDGTNTLVLDVLGIMYPGRAAGEKYVLLKPRASKAIRTHEFLHVIEGESEGTSDHGKAGLNRVFGNNVGGTAVNEAIVEHITQSLQRRRSFKDIDKIVHKGVYIIERELVQVLAQEGMRKVDLRLFLGALFEDGVTTRAQDALKEALQAAFPFTDVAEEISALRATSENAESVIRNYRHDLIERTEAYRRSKKLTQRIGRAVKGRLIRPKRR